MNQTEKKGRNAVSPSKKVIEILAEQGYVLADFENMPIKRVELDEDNSNKAFYDECKRSKKCGHQFPEFVPKSGKVYFHPATLKQMNCNVRHTVHFDAKNGIAYGIPVGINKDGTVKWKSCFVHGSREIDLSSPTDRAEYFVLIHSQYCRDGVHDQFGRGTIKVVNPEHEAQVAVERMRTAGKAIEIIDSFKDSDIGEFAALFGMSPDQIPVINRQALYEIAKSQPKDIIAKFNDDDRKVWAILKSAIHYGFVAERHGEGVMKGALHLGDKLTEAVDYLKNNPDILSDIERQVRDQKIGVAEGKPESPAPKKTRSMA